jgi:hypothetical protein
MRAAWRLPTPLSFLSKEPIAVRTLAISVALATLVMNTFTSVDAAAEEKFQKLSGSQIRARLVGMEITDEVHWADAFAANGTLTSYSMGRKAIGKWNVQKDELCIDRGKDDGGCYQVWLAGKKVELRREGSKLPLEGVLQKQSVRR